jgi:hypothetical protein
VVVVVIVIVIGSFHHALLLFGLGQDVVVSGVDAENPRNFGDLAVILVVHRDEDGASAIGSRM